MEQEVDSVGVDTPAVVSIGLEAGEKEAYKILESTMDAFQEYVFEKAATVVSVVEGCVRMRLRISVDWTNHGVALENLRQLH